jgi:hypothetical protein
MPSLSRLCASFFLLFLSCCFFPFSPSCPLIHMDSSNNIFIFWLICRSSLIVCLLHAWNQEWQTHLWALICIAYADMVFSFGIQIYFSSLSIFGRNVVYTGVHMGCEQV